MTLSLQKRRYLSNLIFHSIHYFFCVLGILLEWLSYNYLILFILYINIPLEFFCQKILDFVDTMEKYCHF